MNVKHVLSVLNYQVTELSSMADQISDHNPYDLEKNL